jgi:hypothetical protein
MKTTNSSVIFGLLLALAGGSTLDARAADKPETPSSPSTPAAPPKAESKKSVPQQLSGKVVAADKYLKTITLQVNNVSYVLQTADATRFTLAGKETGKEKTIADVIVGEHINVTVLLRELTDARVEIAVLAVELGVGEEAQGRKRGRGKGKNNQSPFHAPPPKSPGIDGPATPPRP